MKKTFQRLFTHDRFINGLIAGAVVPIVSFALLIILFENLGILSMDQQDQALPILRPRTLALLALCLNLVIINVFKNLRWNESIRGLAVSMFLCITLWMLKYGKDLF